jgi:serine/threonine protein kinase
MQTTPHELTLTVLPDELEELVSRFEEAWHRDPFPEIESHLPSRPPSDPARRALLTELLLVDMEYRWRSVHANPRESSHDENASGTSQPSSGESVALPLCPRLEQYAKRYPELGPPERLPVEVIVEEYRIRHRWGDRPDHDEYRRRFPESGSELHAALRSVDTELAKLRKQATEQGDTGAAQPVRDEQTESGLELDTTEIPADKSSQPTLTEQPSSPAKGERDAAPPTGSGIRAADRQSWPTFDRYKIIKTLGQGGMGTVYLALDTELDRQVALKVPVFGEEDRDLAIRRFYREARAAATLTHRNICPVHDVGKIDDVHFLTMAYIEGEPLKALMQQNEPLSSCQVIDIVQKLALALQEAHDHGVIHRDLKPSNIMLDKRGEAIVMDFGLAKRQDQVDASLTHPDALAGTPAYMAPEQLSGGGERVGPLSDLYSLGVIMHEMLTGRRLFQGTIAEVLTQILYGSPKAPAEIEPNVDTRLSAICLKAMAKDPQDRYASALELAEELAALQESSGSSDPATEPTVIGTLGELQPPRASRVRRWATVSCAAIVLAAGLFTAQQFVSKAPKSDDNPGSNRAEANSPTAPQLEIHFQRALAKSGYQVLSTNYVPLKDRDRVQLRVALRKPAYLYLYWYDAEGKVTRLWPERPDKQAPLTELWSPRLSPVDEEQEWHEIGGAHGLECAVALTRDKPLTAAELAAFEKIELQFAQLDEQGNLVRISRDPQKQLISSSGKVRGLTDKKPKSRKKPLPEKEPEQTTSTLLLPQGDLDRLFQFPPPDPDRALTGTVKTIKGTKPPTFDNFEERLKKSYQSYHGLVFPHN